MFFTNKFISRKLVMIWLALISTTVLSSELVHRGDNTNLRDAISIKQPMDIPSNKTF